MTPVRRVPSLFLLSLPLLFIAFLLLAALAYDRRDLAVLSILVLALSAGSRLWASLSPARMGWQISVDRDRAFAGEDLSLSAAAENRKLLPVWAEVSLTVGHSRGEERTFTGEDSLLWRQGARFTWEMGPLARGVLRVGPAAVTTADLFGFFPIERKRPEGTEVVVYPRLVALKALFPPRLDLFGASGGRSPVADPVYILGTTDYRPGTPAKLIHWKASARHDRLQEKVLDSTTQAKVLVVLDTQGFFDAGSEEAFERTVEVVASLSVLLDRRGCAVGLVTNGEGAGAPVAVPAYRDPGRPRAILESLARVSMTPCGAVADVLGQSINVPWGTTCLYFAFREDGAARAAGKRLLSAGTTVLFFSLDAAMDLAGLSDLPGAASARKAGVP